MKEKVLEIITIEIREVDNIAVCGDGCCHDNGLIIDKLISGEWEDGVSYLTGSKSETERVIELMKDLYGEDKVKFTALNE